MKETEVDVTSSYAALSRDVLEKRLATAEKRLHALLPPNERFDGMMFGPDDAYLSLAEPEQDPAKKLALEVANRLYGNPSLEECRRTS